jgi:choline monooxygenase
MTTNPNQGMPLSIVLEKLKAAVAVPFEQARPIPAALNHSQTFFEHEQASVFTPEWICIGREDEISSHGDYLTHEIAGVPVLVVRQKDGQVAAFVNACAHRFACLVPDASGSTKKFTCRYHAWTYDCSGQLIRAPYMEMKQDFDVSNHRLRPLHSEVWEGFVYVTLAEHPSTKLNEVLAPLQDRVVGRFDMGCYQTVLRESMEWNANWKNLIENFSESYHVPIAHRKTFAQHNKPLEDYVCGEDSDYYGYHRATQPDDSGSGAAHPRNERLEGEWRRMMVDFCIYPCHLVTLMPDYLWYISVQPRGTDKMQATWGVAIPPEVLADVSAAEHDDWLAKFKSYMDVANEEDRVLVEALHQGSASPILPDGTYHPIERNLWQFNRYLARCCGELPEKAK